MKELFTLFILYAIILFQTIVLFIFIKPKTKISKAITYLILLSSGASLLYLFYFIKPIFKQLKYYLMNYMQEIMFLMFFGYLIYLGVKKFIRKRRNKNERK